MNCLRCNTPNEDGAKFCKNCGMDLNFIPSYQTNNSNSGDALLIAFLAFAVFSNIAQYVIGQVFQNWSSGPGKYIQVALWMLQNVSYILIPMSIKDKSMKTVGLIITILLIIYWLFINLKYLISLN